MLNSSTTSQFFVPERFNSDISGGDKVTEASAHSTLYNSGPQTTARGPDRAHEDFLSGPRSSDSELQSDRIMSEILGEK